MVQERISQAQITYGRIVVKAGTNVLTNESKNVDMAVMAELVGQIASLHRVGVEIVLVTSGAVAAGQAALELDHSSRSSPGVQVLAAIGQSRLMHAYQDLFAGYGINVAQALITWQDVERRVGYLNVRNTLTALLEQKVVPIVNENDVVDTSELDARRIGDNDTLSALVTNLVDADLLLMLTDTGGLYSADPNRDPKARLIPKVTQVDEGILALAEEHRNELSRGGMASKLKAAQRAGASGATVVIGPGRTPGSIIRAAKGQHDGTIFPSHMSPVDSRKRWLLSGMAGNGGTLKVDDGAVDAIQSRNGSLLPAGISSVRGAFQRGDVVEIQRMDGQRIAVGIANYSAMELTQLAGHRSGQIERILGYDYGQEAVHRNNLALTDG